MKKLYWNGLLRQYRKTPSFKQKYGAFVLPFLLFLLLLQTTGSAQTVFTVPRDAGKRIVPEHETRKIWIDILHDHPESRDYEIEIRSTGLQMIDRLDYGYSVTDVLDDSSNVASRIYHKTISILGESKSEVAFFHLGTGIKSATNSDRGVVIKIKDLQTDTYLLPVHEDASGDSLHLILQYPNYFWGHYLEDVSTGGEGTNVYDAISDPVHYPNPAGGAHQWFIEGLIVLDGTSPIASYNDFTFTNITFVPELIADITRLSNVTLVDETSSLVVRSPNGPGDVTLDASGIIVQSGGSGMGNGIIVEPGAICHLKSCLIQDQITGITLVGDAVLILEDTYFTDNIVSIKVVPDPNATSPSPAFITMKNTHFSGTGNIKDRSLGRMYPLSHISVEEGAYLEIEVENAEKAYMYHADYGIYSKNAGDVLITGEGEIDFSRTFFSSLAQSNYEHFGFAPAGNATLFTPPVRGIGIYVENQNNEDAGFTFNGDGVKVWEIKEPLTGVMVKNSNFEGYDIHVTDAEDDGVEVSECNERLVQADRFTISADKTGFRIHENSATTILLADHSVTSDLGADLFLNVNTQINLSGSELYTEEGIHIRRNNASRIRVSDNYAETVLAGVKVLDNRAARIRIDENEIYCFKDNITSVMNRMSTVLVEDNILWAAKGEGMSGLNTHGVYIAERSMANPFEEIIDDPFNLPLGTYVVRGNDIRMRGAQYGVNAVNCRMVQLHDNQVNMEGTIGEPVTNSFGIILQGGQSNIVSCNTVESLNEHARANTGIWLSGSHENFVRDNSISWLNQGMILMGDNMNTELRANVFHRHRSGLAYGAPGTIALTGPQLYKGNQWHESQSGTTILDAVLYAAQTSNINRYIVNEAHEPLCMPEEVVPATDWFIDEDDENNHPLSMLCESEAYGPPSVQQEDFFHENFRTMVQDTTVLGPYDEEIRQNHYRYQYRGLEETDRPYPFNIALIPAGLESRGLNLDLADAQIATEAFIFADSTGLNATGLNTTVNGVTLPLTATDQEEAVLKALQALRDLVTADTTGFSAQLPALAILASSCPLEYGEAVYWARMLLGPDHEVAYTDYSDCDRTFLFKQDKPQGRSFAAYPVPSAGAITVALPEAAAELHVLDLQGQIIQSHRTGEQELFDLRIPVQGVYIIAIKTHGGELFTRKVVILQ